MSYAIRLQLGPFTVQVDSEFHEIEEWLHRDFLPSYSISPDLVVTVTKMVPEPAPFYWLPFSRSRWWATSERNRAVFFGKVGVEYSYARRTAFLYGEDFAALYDVLEMVLASFAGEAADEQGWHRTHALGVSLFNEGVLFLGGTGVGKTSLGARLLKSNSVQFFSDDQPWVADEGTLIAFPHRFSFKRQPLGFSEDSFRAHQKTGYGERYFLDANVLSGRWAQPKKIQHVVLLRKSGSEKVKTVSRLRVFFWLVRWLVLGHETSQIAELRLRPGRRFFTVGMRQALSRLKTAWRLSQRCQGHVLKFKGWIGKENQIALVALERLAKNKEASQGFLPELASQTN